LQQRTNNPLEPQAAEIWWQVVMAERRHLYPDAERVEELIRRHPENDQAGRPMILAAHERKSDGRGVDSQFVRFADRPVAGELEESELELAVAGCAEKD
jgi:hypothetical protein